MVLGMNRNLPYKNPDQVRRLRDLSKPVRRHGDMEREKAIAPIRRKTRKGN